MKSKTFKRCIAIMLCMVIVLSGSGYLLAESLQEGTTAGTETEVQSEEGTTVEEEQNSTDEGTVEVDVPEDEEEQTQENAEAPAQEETSSETEEQVAETPAEEEVAGQATSITKEIKDANGNVICTVVADVPEGAFNAKPSELEMTVDALTNTEEENVGKLIEDALAENTYAENCVMYRVTFKVNGTDTEPTKSVDVDFKGTGLQVADASEANVFYFAPAKSESGINEDTLVEIPQREAKMHELLNAGTGKTREQLEEENDFSELTVQNGVASELKMEVRRNRIYGCYITKENTSEENSDSYLTNASEENQNLATQELTSGNVSLTYQYGKLTASYDGNMDDYGYVWYRNVNNGGFAAQEPTSYTSATGTSLGRDIKADGTELYIALNGGALGYKRNGVTNNKVQYYVAVYNQKDIESDGTPVSGATPVATSSVYNVTSYYEVQNGSFETPEVYSNYNHWQYSNSAYASAGGVWQTTGVGTGNHASHDIEIINTEDGGFKSPYSWYGSDKAADGNQFAELNCEAAGALYQDVLTTPGETLNYQLAHRARGSNANSTPETDTMYVVIMSTEMAITQGVTTQDKVQDIINNPGNYPGATVAQYSATDQAWSIHQGSYRVLASSQYSTRFFFVSGATASGKNTVGNFLDDIKFTRDVLTPVEGTANVTFTKTINGLETSSEADKIARGLTFTVGGKTLRYSDLTWSWANGVYTGSTTFTLSKSECGTLDVKEEGTLDATGYTRSSALFVNNTIANNGTSGSATVKVNRTVAIEFKNNYTKNSNPGGNGGSGEEDKNVMTHEKYIKKNADGTYDITLNASGSIGSQTNKAKLDIVLVVDTSGSMDDDDKLEDTKKAINALVDVFANDDKKVDVQYKLVTFSTSSNIKTDKWVSGKSLKEKVKKLEADGGTNYDKGLANAATAINSSTREGAKKIVIFLTDGQPTYYGDRPKGYGNQTSKSTLDAAIESARKISCSGFYAVGIGLPDTTNIYTHDGTLNNQDNLKWNHGHWEGNWWSKGWVDDPCPDGGKNQDGYDVYEQISGLEILTRVANATSANTKEPINLSSSSELTDKFKDIAGETLNFTCSNVVISDTLSKYVKTTDSSKIKVNVAKMNEDGKTFTDISGNGREFTLEVARSEAGGDVYEGTTKIATARYSVDSETGRETATLTFEPDYELKKDYYYYISITNVTPTDEAFNEYLTNGYPSEGSDYTDASGDGYVAINTGDTITSSKKDGFYSNAKATISYKWKNKEYKENYPNPVVQVEPITVKKEWDGIQNPTDTVLVQLVDKSGKAVKDKILKLSSQNDYAGKVAVEQASNYGGIRELKEVTKDTEGAIKYEDKYYVMIDNNGVQTLGNNAYKVTYTSETKDGKVTYTVTNTKSSQKIKVLKKQSGSGSSNVYLEGAEFTLKDNGGKIVKIGTNITGTYISDENGLVLEGDIEYGEYTLTEVKAPQGYTVLKDPIRVTVDENGITVNENEKVSYNKSESDDIYVITVTNDMLYDLPKTGGIGIFWYTIGGMLLMMAAALVLYKRKCREVLNK